MTSVRSAFLSALLVVVISFGLPTGPLGSIVFPKASGNTASATTSGGTFIVTDPGAPGSEQANGFSQA
ncbi:MAG: hypothetical protein ACRDH9_05070 [Actinomycetota bacterium]